MHAPVGMGMSMGIFLQSIYLWLSAATLRLPYTTAQAWYKYNRKHHIPLTGVWS